MNLPSLCGFNVIHSFLTAERRCATTRVVRLCMSLSSNSVSGLDYSGSRTATHEPRERERDHSGNSTAKSPLHAGVFCFPGLFYCTYIHISPPTPTVVVAMPVLNGGSPRWSPDLAGGIPEGNESPEVSPHGSSALSFGSPRDMNFDPSAQLRARVMSIHDEVQCLRLALGLAHSVCSLRFRVAC